MNAQEFTSLADQVTRQTPELAAYDAEIALRQLTVDVLQAVVDAADDDGKAAAQQALAGPAAQLAEVKARAGAIRASIAQCQVAMAASGLVVDAGAMQAQRLAEARAAMWEWIKAKRDHLSEHGGYLVSGKWFHSDAKSKTQQLSLFVMGAAVPAVQWKTMDGSFVTMSQALAGGIFQAAAAKDMAIFGAAETHRAAMEASATPAAYDFSGGWPATFAG